MVFSGGKLLFLERWESAVHFLPVLCAMGWENKTGKKFYVFNTHFDHLGKVARRESAKLVLKKIKEIAGKSPVILTGDFNATPEDEPIKIILNPEDGDKLIDAEKISKNGHYGPYGTFNAFKSEQIGKHIDYIFVSD